MEGQRSPLRRVAVSIVKGRVFTVCQYGNIEYVRALDEATGCHLWTAQLNPAIQRISMMSRLLPKIRKLPERVRIISHEFKFPRRISPIKSVNMRSTEDAIEHRLHLYVTPLVESPR